MCCVICSSIQLYVYISFFPSGRVRKNYIVMVFMNILYSHIVLCSLSKEVTGCIKLM